MNFPVSWGILKLGAPPYSVYIVAILIGVGCLLLRLAFLRKMVDLPIRKYLNNVVVNVLFTNICGAVVPTIVYLSMSPGIYRFISVGVVSIICASIAVVFIGCTSGERNFILGRFNTLKSRFIKTQAV